MRQKRFIDCVRHRAAEFNDGVAVNKDVTADANFYMSNENQTPSFGSFASTADSTVDLSVDASRGFQDHCYSTYSSYSEYDMYQNYPSYPNPNCCEQPGDIQQGYYYNGYDYSPDYYQSNWQFCSEQNAQSSEPIHQHYAYQFEATQ